MPDSLIVTPENWDRLTGLNNGMLRTDPRTGGVMADYRAGPVQAYVSSFGQIQVTQVPIVDVNLEPFTLLKMPAVNEGKEYTLVLGRNELWLEEGE